MSAATALVTGASSGIGHAFARLLAREGHRLVLVSRDRSRLQALADQLRAAHGTESLVIAADLSVPGAAGDVYAQIERSGWTVDVLINNAGVPMHGAFAAGDTARQLAMIRLNVEAVTHLARLCMPGMLQRRRGRILNVASTAAFQPGPLMAVYYATKAYVLSLSEALAFEAQGSGVTVTALCPGPTRSEFQRRAGMGHTILFGRGVMPAERVAEAGYRAMLRGRAVVIPGFMNWLMVQLVRAVPRGVVLRVVRMMQTTRRPLKPPGVS
jgi:short-subunit dehydrogenase